MSDIVNTAQTVTVPSVKVKRHGPAPKFRPIIYQPPKPKYHVSVISTFAEAREHAKKVVGGVWTPDKLDELRQLIADGMSLVELGEHFGTTPAAVRGTCYRNKIQSPPLRRNRKKYEYHKENNARIIEMMDAGMAASEIAGELDMIVSAVYQIMYLERKRRKANEQHQSDS